MDKIIKGRNKIQINYIYSFPEGYLSEALGAEEELNQRIQSAITAEVNKFNSELRNTKHHEKIKFDVEFN